MFQRAYERVGILLVKVFQKVGKSAISVEKKSQGLTDAVYVCEKVEKTFWLCDLCIYSRDVSSKIVM